MKKFYLSAVIVAVIALPSLMVRAQTLTPAQQASVGTWDLGEGGVLETYVQNGKLYGKVLHTRKDLDNNGVCKKCDGTNKNKPYVGMVIIYNFAPEGATEVWGGGRFIDQATGLIAQGKIKAENNGAILNVRGYFGNPILGQTVIWKRIK